MKKQLAFIAILALISCTASADDKNNLCNFAHSAIADASKIRGLKQTRKVDCLVHDRDQVKHYLLSAVNEKIPAQKLEMEQTIYRALGFIPQDYNYKDGIVELYLSQIGGYYDPEKKHFVMAAWMPAVLQTTVAVHELTHALQDQYYDLENFMDSKSMDTDMLLARSALVEGDATAVMTDYSRELFGQGPISGEISVQNLMLQNVVGAALVGGTNNIPQSLQFMLIFPYTSGLRFAHTVLRRGGYAELDRVFKNPPNTTEEILHPEKYFSEKADFNEVTEAELLSTISDGRKSIYTDVLGEFSISALLSGLLTNKAQAIAAAAGWAGDRIAIIDQAGKRQIAWLSRWDTLEDAKEFLAAIKIAIEKHYGSHFTGEMTNLGMQYAKGKITLSLSNQTVLLVISGI